MSDDPNDIEHDRDEADGLDESASDAAGADDALDPDGPGPEGTIPGEAPAPDAADAAGPSKGTVLWSVTTNPMSAVSLTNLGYQLVDGPDGADAAIVSTRVPRGEIATLVAEAVKSFPGPVIVLAHPGGELGAVEGVRAGARAVIAEGDKESLEAALSGQDRVGATLVDAYDANVGRGVPQRVGGAATSQTTGLPAASALAARMSAITTVDSGFRVVSFRILHWIPATARMSPEAISMLTRRLAAGFSNVCNGVGELFDLGEGSFLLLASDLTSAGAEQLGTQLAEVAGGYTPDAHAALAVAVGHAGLECGSDPTSLRELAGRAEQAAALEEASNVLGAADLVGPLATATELEVNLKLVEMVERHDDGPPRAEVARLAAELATRLGFEGHERSLVRFVAHMSEIGKVCLGPDAYVTGTDLWKQHPETSAAILAPVAGRAAAAAIRAQHEHFDGSGFPDGLSGAGIPFAARIVAVADAYLSAGRALAPITAGAGSLFDPTVVAALDELITDTDPAAP